MDTLNTLTERYFADTLGIALDALLAPLANEAGESLAAGPVYTAIRNAREEDDDSLPMGAWERELKRADWTAVSRLCIKALGTQSKDLQIAAWLLEAEIHNRGFRSLGPCLNLIAMLSKSFWPSLFPHDLEHRSNIYLWIVDKMRAPLRRLPFTATGSGTEYGWADWEQAQRNEQLRATLGREAEQTIEGTTLNLFSAALASTPSTAIVATQEHLTAAQIALATLEAVLKPVLDEEGPSLEPLRELLENIELMLATEAKRRGLVKPPIAPPATAAASAVPPPSSTEAPAALGEVERSQLYHSLAVMADELARLEPHSPVPYLIRRAVSWGNLNTAELYSEVFVRCGGQINIFELLGLEDQITAQPEHATH